MTAITQQILDDVAELPEQMQAEVLNFVHFLKQKTAKKPAVSNMINGEIIAEIMNRIAARGNAFSDIQDPVEWQRNIRKDRPLPGREDL
jgi:hypothetical protein